METEELEKQPLQMNITLCVCRVIRNSSKIFLTLEGKLEDEPIHSFYAYFLWNHK